VDLPGLTLRQIVHAPPAEVFAAFLSADALKYWWAPEGYEVVQAEVDARVGGSYRLTMRAVADARIVSIHGVYQEITPPTKLVFTHRFEQLGGGSLAAVGLTAQHTLVSVELVPHGEGTELVLVQEKIPTVEAQGILSAGWHGILDKLARYMNGPGGLTSRPG
jgi:uncharacterized protein YndB with AHSA1/START domain